jgi:YidC/Oxa1 family membrane protein insertase
MLAATEITSKNVDPQQRWLMRLLPIGFTAFLLNFPAGLFVYWITSNLVTLTQNYVIYNYGPGKKNADGKKSADGEKTGASGTKSRERQTQNSNGQRTSDNKEEDAAVRAAKIAKRKRRKKKK